MADDTLPPKPAPTEGPRSFAVLLEGMRDDEGDSLNTILSTELHELTDQLRVQSRARDAKVSGELTLKLKITVRGGNAEVVPEINTKRPKDKAPEYTLWITRGGNLSTEVPRQEKLPLRSVADASNDNPIPTPKTKEL